MKKKYFYMLSTGLIYITEQEVTYDKQDYTVALNGRITTNVFSAATAKPVQDFSFHSRDLIAEWWEEDKAPNKVPKGLEEASNKVEANHFTE